MKPLLSRAALCLSVLVLAALACGLPAGLTGGDGLAKTDDLWGDVPRMEGLEPSSADLPLYARLLMQTVLSQVLSGGTGTGEWIIFTSAKTPEDLKAFYTNDRMAENGWEDSEEDTCVEGSAQGVTEAGVFCVFQKREDNRYIGLMIIGGEDGDTGETMVMFIRVENEETPEPASP